MMTMRVRRGSGHAFLVLAAAAFTCSVPVWADPLAPVDPAAEETLTQQPIVEPDLRLDETDPELGSEAIDTEAPDQSYDHIGDGVASYYGNELAGNRTASGERFDPYALTAAHRTLPMGSKLRVTNKANGKSVVVRVNDRGPFAGKRVVDVSLAAARQISMIGAGIARVRLELLR